MFISVKRYKSSDVPSLGIDDAIKPTFQPSHTACPGPQCWFYLLRVVKHEIKDLSESESSGAGSVLESNDGVERDVDWWQGCVSSVWQLYLWVTNDRNSYYIKLN